MTKLLVLYPPPADADTFERRYREEHAPMVREKMAGLRRFSAGRVMGAPGGAAPPFARVAQLEFDSRDALDAALSSPDGRSVVGHALEISTGGPITALVVEDDG
ncbi:MAG TPA: EthD family reductase [Gemmatimonadaceae bacterium]|nr:EthD family reductase [Gemmatimonadaceae bacterium]